MKNNLILAIVGVVVVGSVGLFVVNSNFGSKTNDSSNNTAVSADANKEDQNNQPGYIYIDGGDGTLIKASQYDNMSYIGESARGTEAYLASQGSVASYEFESEKSGSYRLEISLSDDAMHDNGSRSVTVTLNNGGIVMYNHISEDTKGWKWYSLGILSVKKGKNVITFSKDKSTTAAFVMDQFRFVPVLVNEE